MYSFLQRFSLNQHGRLPTPLQSHSLAIVQRDFLRPLLEQLLFKSDATTYTRLVIEVNHNLRSIMAVEPGVRICLESGEIKSCSASREYIR
jgi:hypothetical protein